MTQLRDALGGDRDGFHVEISIDGRDLAVFRPSDEDHRVIDVTDALDVTAEFRAADGAVDLFRHVGISGDRAAPAMHLAGSDVDAVGDPTPARSRVRPLAMSVAAVAIGGGALVAQTAASIGLCLGVGILALVVALSSGRASDHGSDALDDAAIGGNIRAAQDSTGLTESLPVVVTGLFTSIPPRHKAAALDAAIRAGSGGQVVIVTEDRDVIDLARFREMAGEVLVVHPVAHDASPA